MNYITPEIVFLVSFAVNVRVVMHQALCDDPNNGCEGDYYAFRWGKNNSWRIQFAECCSLSLVLGKIMSLDQVRTWKVMLHSNAPWYNDEIALEMRFRQRLKGYDKWRTTSLESNRSCYLQQCGMMNALNHRSKQTSYSFIQWCESYACCDWWLPMIC